MVKTPIIHITTFLQGGAGKVIVDLIERQVADGCTVICISNASSYPGYFSYQEYERRLESLGVLHYKIEGLFKRDELLQKAAVAWLAPLFLKTFTETSAIKSFGGIVHCHAAVPAKIALKARNESASKIKVIQTMHGWGSNKTAGQVRDDIQTLNSLDHVVCVSNASQYLLADLGYQALRNTVIYNGVKERTKPSDHTVFNAEFDDVYKIVCIGSVCDRKNQALLVDAVEVLQSNGVKIACDFYGELDGEYSHSLLKRVEPLIRFHGCVNDASQYLTNYDMLVLPTKSEGLPITVIEAFRDNVMVLASDVPECQELVSHGENGMLFMNNSLEDLCMKIKQAMQLSNIKRNEMTAVARGRYRNELCFDAMYQAYETLYKQVNET